MREPSPDQSTLDAIDRGCFVPNMPRPPHRRAPEPTPKPMIQPLTNRILVRPIEPTQGRIVIPEAHRLEREDEPIEAEVVTTGPVKRNKRGRPIPWSTMEGDRVLLIAYMGAEVQVDGQRHLVVKEQDILAIIGSNVPGLDDVEAWVDNQLTAGPGRG